MKSSDVIDLINALEARYPVDQWSVGELRVWPLVRVRFYTALLAQGLVPEAAPGCFARLEQQASKRLRGLARYCRATLADRRRNASLHRHADVVFLSDGISYTNVQGLWYEKFCDPLIDRLEARGLTTLLLSPLQACYVPRRTPSVFIQPRLDALILRSALRRTRGGEARLPGYDEAVAYLRELALPLPFPSREQIVRQACRVETVAAFYGRLFVRITPRLAFNVSYYATDGMAFNLACRRYGIPVADIQHGVQGEHHIAYGRWQRLPREGYALLPSHFWVWGQAEAAAIGRWSEAVPPWHRPLAGGNLWLAAWQGEASAFARDYDARIAAIAARRPPGARHVLVTLQWGLAPEEETKIFEAARDGDPNWLWWFRVHPFALGDRERVRRALTALGVPAFELDAATDIPLYALLRHMHAHVTHSSSTVLESREFGVPSVVTSAYGVEFFHSQVDDAYLAPAFDAAAIGAAVRRLLTAGPPAGASASVPNRREDEALSALLADARCAPRTIASALAA